MSVYGVADAIALAWRATSTESIFTRVRAAVRAPKSARAVCQTHRPGVPCEEHRATLACEIPGSHGPTPDTWCVPCATMPASHVPSTLQICSALASLRKEEWHIHRVAGPAGSLVNADSVGAAVIVRALPIIHSTHARGRLGQRRELKQARQTRSSRWREPAELAHTHDEQAPRCVCAKRTLEAAGRLPCRTQCVDRCTTASAALRVRFTLMLSLKRTHAGQSTTRHPHCQTSQDTHRTRRARTNDAARERSKRTLEDGSTATRHSFNANNTRKRATLHVLGALHVRA